MKRLLPLLLFAAPFIPVSAASANLVKDPGGEARSKAWILRAVRAKIADHLRFTADRPHSGKYCIEVIDNEANSGHYLSQRITVPAGTARLRFSFRARSAEPHVCLAGLIFNDGKKPERCIAVEKKPFRVEREWTEVELTVTVPEGTHDLDLLICPTTQSSYAETGTIFVDDVSVVVLPPPDTAEQFGIDRVPRPRVDAPYQPADGETLTRNPPSFTFPAVLGWKRGKFTYSVEWSQDPAFPAAKTSRVTGCPYHIVIPDKVLAPGKWYWRYGVEHQQGKTVWSRARAFTVPADAPQLAWVPVDELVKRISQEDLRSYVRKEDLPAIRERAKSGDLKPLADTLEKKLLPELGAELMPEPPYLSKNYLDRAKDFSRMMRSKYMRGSPFYDFFLRMRAPALAYILTGDRRYGEEAKRRVIHFYGTWDPRGPTSLRNNDEPGMHINSFGLSAYEFCRELFTPEERKLVEENMRIRMNEFYDILASRPCDAYPYESHSIYYFQLMGRLGFALVHSYPEDAKKCIDYSLRFFWTYLHPYAFPDGGWSEGPAYGSWGVERLCRYAHVVRMNTGLDLLKIHPFFRNCGYYPLYGWPGKSQQRSFGDGTSPTHQTNMLRICAAINDNPVFLKPGIDRKQPIDWTIWAALSQYDLFKTPDMSKLPTAWCFPSIGFAALRTDMTDWTNDVGLLFQSNPVGAVSHHHNCHNCFMLEAYTEPLAISSGYYDYYGGPHHAGWTRETKSRCGITVDGGKGQMRGGHATGRITRFENGRDFDIVEGDASPAYAMLDTAVRTIVHVRPGIFVIRDRATAKEPHTFEYSLHALAPGAFDEAAQTVTLKAPKAECLVLFLGVRPWKFRSFDKFPIPTMYPAPEQWHFVAAAPEKATSLDLLTVLLPYRTGEAAKLPKVEKLADGVRFTYADGHAATVRFAGDRVLTEKK